MPAPSPLAIATGAVRRLVKEEQSYHRELEEQTQRLQKLESEDPSDDPEGNREYMIKQQRMAVEQTKAVFEPLNERISQAVQKLEDQVALEGEKGDDSNVKELTEAKDAISAAKTAMREIA